MPDLLEIRKVVNHVKLIAHAVFELIQFSAKKCFTSEELQQVFFFFVVVFLHPDTFFSLTYFSTWRRKLNFSPRLCLWAEGIYHFSLLLAVSVASWEIETFHYRYHLEVKICSWDGDAKVGRRNGAATIIIYLPSFTSFSYLFIPYDDHFCCVCCYFSSFFISWEFCYDIAVIFFHTY